MWSRIGILGLGLVAAAVASALFLAGPAGAVHDVVIEFSVVRGAPGSIVEVASQEVEPFLQGTSCAIRVEVTNNPSVHPDSDLLISSGDDTVTLSDFESSPGVFSFAEGELVFGEVVTASVRLGPDGVTSGAISVLFPCDQEPPTTTASPGTTPPPTTTTAPPTEVLPQTELPPAEVAVATVAQPTFTG